jgi:AraC-like DNA-binding protein
MSLSLKKKFQANPMQLSYVSAEGHDRYWAIHFGTEGLAADQVVARHRHTVGYATVVLAGEFEEAGFAGRFDARPGDVLLHGAFDCHAYRGQNRSVQILRLPWQDNLLEGHFRIRDPDELALLAERDVTEAMSQLRLNLIPVPTQELHWTERLAVTLRATPLTHLEAWAESERLSPETVSRGFRRAFDVTPKLFRIENRARRAWNRLLNCSLTLTEIAHEQGFSDLAHLSRAIRDLTGKPPTYWRRLCAPEGIVHAHANEDDRTKTPCVGYT